MLQDIRNNSQSTAAKVVVGLIIVTFALFGAESIVGGLSGEPEVAVVNGEGITVREFERAVEGKRRQIIAQLGDRADPELIDDNLLRSSVLEGLITEKVLLLDADEKGLYIAEEAVDNYIRNIPQFQDDGVFSNERMQMLLRGAGLTLKAYKESLKSQFMIEQARAGLLASSFSLANETNEIVSLDRQSRDFSVATVFKSNYMDSIAVSDEEVKSYHEENKDKYKKAESVDVSYIEISRASLKSNVEIEESRIESLYESELDSFEGEEQRDASHILIKIDDETDEAAALVKINEIAAKLKEGSSFEELAKEHSQDEGSASAGGALGMSGKGVYVSDFEDALFALQKDQVSEPIKTEFGYHLIKLNAIEANKLPSYDELRASLEERLIEEEVDQLYAEGTELMADITYSSADLLEASEELKIEVLQLAGVNAGSQHDVFSSPRIQKVLFTDDIVKEQNNSEVIEIDDGRAIVFRVNTYHEASLLSFEEAKEDIRNEMKETKSAEFAKSVGESFIERVKGGEEANVVAKDMGLDWQQHKGIKRDNIMLNRDLVSRVFTLGMSDSEQPELIGFEVSGGDYGIVSLSTINKGNTENVESTELKSISSMLGNGLGAIDYQIYQTVAENNSEIEKL